MTGPQLLCEFFSQHVSVPILIEAQDVLPSVCRLETRIAIQIQHIAHKSTHKNAHKFHRATVLD
jgi:hypothetical protein